MDRDAEVIAGALPDGVIVLQDGRVVFVNPGMELATGRSPEELGAMTLDEVMGLVLPDDRAMCVDRYQRRLQGEEVPERYELRIFDKQGDVRWLQVHGRRIVFRDEPAILGIVRDISDQKRAAIEQDRIRAMLEQAEDMTHLGSWEYDIPGDNLLVSRQTCELFDLGVSPEQASHAMIQARIHPHDRERVFRVGQECMRQGKGFEYEFRIVTRDGEIREVVAKSQFIPAGGGQPDRVIGSTLDITERRRLEREILEVAQVEQKRLGGELHDTLGQELAGLAFLAKALERRLAEVRSTSAEDARNLSGLAQQAVTRCRLMARGFVPIDKLSESLCRELLSLCEGLAEIHGVPCDYVVEEDQHVHDNTVAMHLYYIACESITNAMRHARASRIRVELTTRGDRGRSSRQGCDPAGER